MPLLYAITILLGSFLLFQVQPLIGRYILPWFGGSPAVWTTCMLFFQVALLAGYGYAHGVTAANRRHQGLIHLALLAVALLCLPIAPDPERWMPQTGQEPVLRILLLLLATIGIPYMVLATNAPLVQHWFVRTFPGKSPYHLYALSNGASLVALLSYPFLVEPQLTLASQASIWVWLFVAYAACCAACALLPVMGGRFASEDHRAALPAGGDVGTPRISAATVTLWLLLSGCGSALLLATTNQLCQEVAVVPFLWVLPLALYLVTFVVCFAGDRDHDRILWGILLGGALLFACRALYQGVAVTLPVQILIYLAALFTGCMVCHGELFRSRPDPRHLTVFYLVIAAGGALGGLFVAVVAPLYFDGFWEYPVTLVVLWASATFAWLRDRGFTGNRRVFLAIGAIQVALIVFSVQHIRTLAPWTVTTDRNFYGVLRVTNVSGSLGPMLNLMHGRILHGSQYTAAERRGTPLNYYAVESGAGLALRHHPRRSAPDPSDRHLRVGVVGLGTGTLAAHGQPGDLFRFYEINPAVIRIANSHFTYLQDSAARTETFLGDARIVLEDELRRGTPQRYDVLLVDAFSSDAIPIHLLTRECLAIYRRHLAPDGLLLFHVTNRFLNLIPVVQTHAAAAGERAALVHCDDAQKIETGKSDWIIVTRNGAFLDSPPVRGKIMPLDGPPKSPILWTDDFAGLWQVLKR